jgi:hypothetical protein
MRVRAAGFDPIENPQADSDRDSALKARFKTFPTDIDK